MKKLFLLFLLAINANAQVAIGGGGGPITSIAGGGGDSTTINNFITSSTNVSGKIYVFTNDINGVNIALSQFAVSTDKMMVGGGEMILQHGDHYLTTAFFYTNEWPANITIRGEGIPGANMVYVGPSTNVNVFRFMGTHANDGVLLSLYCDGVGFYSIHDNTNWLVQLQETGWAMFDNCRFSYWRSVTNNSNRGQGLPEELSTAKATNMGGLYLGPTDTGAGITIRKCYFQYLQNGLYDASDHAYLEDNYFSLIGNPTTGWPTNSPFRLGSAIIKTNGSGAISDSVYTKTHFTLDYICLWDHDNSSEPKSIYFTRVEQCSFRFISAVPNAHGSFVWENSINAAADGTASIQGTTWAISNRPPQYMKITGFNYAIGQTNLSMFPTPNAGFYVSPQGNSVTTGTNNASGWYQPFNLDQWYFTVSGAEAEVNGTYVFKTADWYSPSTKPLLRFFIYTNTVAARTNLLIYDPSGSAISQVPWGIITKTNHVLDENVLYYDPALTDVIPPATTWDALNGTSNNITISYIYGQFTVDPNASLSTRFTRSVSNSAFGDTAVGKGVSITNSFLILGTNTGAQQALLTLQGGSVAFWASNNGSLYIISANDAGTKTTNIIVAPH